MMHQRRNPLRLIVSKEIQLRILGLVGGAVFFCMTATALVHFLTIPLLWCVVLLVALGLFTALYISRCIAGPLYRIEKDLEAFLEGAQEGKKIHLRQGDPMQHLAELINKLIERTR